MSWDYFEKYFKAILNFLRFEDDVQYLKLELQIELLYNFDNFLLGDIILICL